MQVKSTFLGAHAYPNEFKENKTGYVAAANIWKNTYSMFLQKLADSVNKKCLLLNIENLNKDHSSILPLFDFLGENFNGDIANRRQDKIVSKRGFRSFKDPNDIRNSDLYVDKSFYFSQKEIDQILPIILDTADKMKIDVKESADEYLEFHRNEKEKIGFV